MLDLVDFYWPFSGYISLTWCFNSYYRIPEFSLLLFIAANRGVERQRINDLMIREWREDPDVVDANQTWKVSATMKSKTRKLVLTMSVGLHVGAEKGWYTVVHGYDDNFLQCRLFNLFQWKVFLSKISICKTKLNYGNTSYLYTTGVTHCALVFSKMFKADQTCTPFVVFFISYNFSSSYFYPQMYIVYHQSYLKQSTTHRSFGKQSCLGWLLFQFFFLMFIFLFPVTSSRVVLLPCWSMSTEEENLYDD